jgi:hypothetical protein
MNAEEIVQRLRANAAAAGVRVTEGDVARLVEQGFVERIARVERIIEDVGADDVAPDYLQLLSVYAGDARHG